MINAAIKKWTQSGESRGNKCTAPNNGQRWRETNGKSLSIAPTALGGKMHPVFTESSDLTYCTHHPDNKSTRGTVLSML